MKILFSGIIIFLLCVLMSNCTNKIDLTQDIEAIRKIEEAKSKAFISNDPKVFWAIMSTHVSSVVHVEDGEVDRSEGSLSHKDSLGILKMYDKTKWNEAVELTPKIIRVSADGSMAWIVTHEKFIGKYIRKHGDEWKEQYFTEAALIVYEKQNGKWVAAADAYTYNIPD